MNDSIPDGGFAPISPNPYIVGNPVRGRSMFFGREAEFDLVRRRFQDSSRGGLLVFCGERRSGKTSILFQILDGRLGPDFVPVLIDMQSMAVGTEVEFLTRVSEEVRSSLGPHADELPLPDFSRGSNHSATFQQFIRDVLKREAGKRLILLFDEYELFENKIESGLLSEDVLHVLASLMENQPVFLVFTGSQHLEQRRQEYWKILGKSQHKMISYLERGDAENLIRQPVEGRVQFAPGTVEAIWRLTAGQPFYTQAICQSLVDQLNEGHTSGATPEIVARVVDGIVDNPLPQMIFLWDGLERGDKLVLALLAESLADGDARGGVDDLARLLRRREYPLVLDRAQIATTLEKLFKHEMLLRSDHGSTHGYAFRMDLWRLWVRRQHSVWQVMREEGLEIRPGPLWRRKPLVFALLGAAVVVTVAAFVIKAIIERQISRDSHLLRVPSAAAWLALEAEPENTVISLDGQRVGIGMFRDAIDAGRGHRLHLHAAGYADFETTLTLAVGDSLRRRVVLRELVGDLRIVTDPAGAEIRVDDVLLKERSPTLVTGLSAARTHRVEATLAGYGGARQEVTIEPRQVVPLILPLRAVQGEVLVTTEPTPCEVHVDGTLRGGSPILIPGLSQGLHKFSARRDGFSDAETTLAIGLDTRQVHLRLEQEPPGYLTIKGDLIAEFLIDGVVVKNGVYNTGIRELRPGSHEVRVIPARGEPIDTTIVVRSGESATYDYPRGTVERRPEKRR